LHTLYGDTDRPRRLALVTVTPSDGPRNNSRRNTSALARWGCALDGAERKHPV